MNADQRLAIDSTLADAFGRQAGESLRDAATRVLSMPLDFPPSWDRACVRAAARTLLRLHYIDPWQAMQRAARKLAAGGS